MRFYYVSIFSILLLGLIYLIGTGLLTWLGLWLRKRWKRARRTGVRSSNVASQKNRGQV